MTKFTFSRISTMVNAPTTINGVITEIETAFDSLLSRDGTAPNQITADVDFNSKKILNLPSPTGSTEPVTLGYFQATVQSADAQLAANQAAASAASALTYKNAAQTAQTNAEASAAIASTARTGAETAQGLAEDARDAAFANANVYADTATGLAAVGEGGQFMVVVGDEIVRYQDNSGVAVEVARYQTATQKVAVADLPDATTHRGISVYVVDEIGGPAPAFSDSVAWRRHSDGEIVQSCLPSGAVVYLDFEKKQYYWASAWHDSVPAGTFGGTYLITDASLIGGTNVTMTVEFEGDWTQAYSGTLVSLSNAASNTFTIGPYSLGTSNFTGDERRALRSYNNASLFDFHTWFGDGKGRRRVTSSCANNEYMWGCWDAFPPKQDTAAVTPGTFTAFTRLSVNYNGTPTINGQQLSGATVYKVIVYNSFKTGTRTGDFRSPIEECNLVNTTIQPITVIGDSFNNGEVWLENLSQRVSASGRGYFAFNQEALGGSSFTQTLNRFFGEAPILSLSGDGVTATLTCQGGGFAGLPQLFPVGGSIVIAGCAPNGFNGTYTVASQSYVGLVQTITFACAQSGSATALGTIGVSGFRNVRSEDTIVAMEGGLDETSAETINAFARLMSQLHHDRFVFFECSPQELTGANYTTHMSNMAAFEAYLGDRFVRMTSKMQRLACLYPKTWVAGEKFGQWDWAIDLSSNDLYVCIEAHTSSGSAPISTNADAAKWYKLVPAWVTGTAYTANQIRRDYSTPDLKLYRCNTGHTSAGSLPISTNADAAKWTLISDATAVANGWWPYTSRLDTIHPDYHVGHRRMAEVVDVDLTARGWLAAA